MALGKEGDIFIPISTSGRSSNVLLTTRWAKENRLECVGLTGKTGGDLAKLIECIKIPSDKVPRIQEAHILIGHIVCKIIEEKLIFDTNT